jgi:hypothetical protein
MKAEILAMDTGAVTIAVDGIIVHLVDALNDDWQVVTQDDITRGTSYCEAISHKDGLSRLLRAIIDYSNAREETA